METTASTVAVSSVDETDWFILIIAVVSLALCVVITICYKQCKTRLFTFNTTGTQTQPERSVVGSRRISPTSSSPPSQQDPPSYWDLQGTDGDLQKASLPQLSTVVQVTDENTPSTVASPPSYGEAVASSKVT